MSVLVKGMEKPEHCGYCRFRYDGICHAIQKTQYSMDECPLVGIDDVLDTNVGDTISRRSLKQSIVASLILGGEKTLDQIIDEKPSIDAELQWIPCSERLPEDDNEVLVTILDREDDYVEVYKGFYEDGEWWTQWCHGCLRLKKEPCGDNVVTAWMQLPKAYEAERKEE